MRLRALDAATRAATGDITPEALRTTIIGRSAAQQPDVHGVTVPGDYTRVGKMHCSVDNTGPDPAVWTVTDLGSKNGTLLQHVKLRAGVAARLAHGNLLQLGVHKEGKPCLR